MKRENGGKNGKDVRIAEDLADVGVHK